MHNLINLERIQQWNIILKVVISKVATKKTNLELKLMHRAAEKVSIGSENDSHSSDIWISAVS